MPGRDPALPPDRIPARWGATEGAFVDVTGYTPPAPIPLERQQAWGRAFRAHPPEGMRSIISRMGLAAALDRGGALLGGYQRLIVELEQQGLTPESWSAAHERREL